MSQDFAFLDQTSGGNSPLDSFPKLQTLFLAVLSACSGTTEPSKTWAGQLWLDTSASMLRVRNDANDGWIDLLDMSTGQVANAAALEGNAASAFAPASHVANTSNPHGVTAAQVQLGNVLNKTLRFEKNGGAALNATWNFNTATGELAITTS